MKLLFTLLVLLFSVSNCYGQSSSSSSSSEECPPYYSGPTCSVLTPHISFYQAANPTGGYVTFYGYFGDDLSGLSIKIGDNTCYPSWSISSSRIECGVDPLNLYEFYDVEITTTNGVNIFKEDFYSPYIDDCEHGNFYMGTCICTTGYEGQLCNVMKSPYITSISSTSVDGGVTTIEGWFTTSPENFSLFIGGKKVIIISSQSTFITGYAPQGTGTQDVTIFGSNNQLVFTGSNLFTYDPNMCFNNCFNNGECNNGVCTCNYPFVGDFCSHTKDSSCQCSYD
ncbi:hypothetical protein DICPUDRAFT_43525 [Dictyostelium purpureum]|uniref:EGF-like domain-containing protein n=1 Tax=Dictyostelium purpureum TaxID=5786 RepID=F1A498_DICPU|nr:uncharacterized protein DICPUDRAFT_43525 [Dictyostelium purpureum]EGC28983.1 hypothetical protein DICPUDRAFT_43525 [Dictyostelium purpureum]|eukprot:XP_003294492.1 hypothetical protein DICPUDRAFT_43525 [Dictyostelium purpureum]